MARRRALPSSRAPPAVERRDYPDRHEGEQESARPGEEKVEVHAQEGVRQDGHGVEDECAESLAPRIGFARGRAVERRRRFRWLFGPVTWFPVRPVCDHFVPPAFRRLTACCVALSHDFGSLSCEEIPKSLPGPATSLLERPPPALVSFLLGRCRVPPAKGVSWRSTYLLPVAWLVPSARASPPPQSAGSSSPAASPSSSRSSTPTSTSIPAPCRRTSTARSSSRLTAPRPTSTSATTSASSTRTSARAHPSPPARSTRP